MENKYIFKQDYDEKYKIDKENKVFCYSKKQLKKLHPNEDYTIIGEAKKNNKKDQIATLVFDDTTLIVSELDENSKIIYSRSKFVCVGENQYIVLLENRIPFIFILFGLLLGILLTYTLLFNIEGLIKFLTGNNIPVVNPDHPLPDIDPVVEFLENDNSEKAESEDGGGSVSMIYTLESELSLSTGKVDMYFANPNASNHDVAIELYITSNGQEILIAQSGLVPMGSSLSQLTMLEDSAILQEGVYSGLYKVIFYNPQTGERALVESTITDLTVTVLN